MTNGLRPRPPRVKSGDPERRPGGTLSHVENPEGTIDCAVIWGTSPFPKPTQSRIELEARWQLLWFIAQADRSNADHYSPILETTPE